MWFKIYLFVVLVLPIANCCLGRGYESCVSDNNVDVIIVGAGTAGSVIAKRLSEVDGLKVLVIEAGKVPLEMSDIPYFWSKTIGTEMDWNFTSVPQENCCQASKDKKASYLMGRALGGRSSVNNMIFSRGSPADYDNLKALGNDGWGFNDISEYFIEPVDYKILMTKEDAAYHQANSEAPVKVQNPAFRTVMTEAFQESGRETNQSMFDLNGEFTTGFTYPPFTINAGERWSTWKGYLKPAYEDGKVTLVGNAFVTKVLFENLKATGVVYERDGKTCQVLASKEVILAAGPVNTPKILLLSGIGPKDQLESQNISVVHELPGVGLNLHDQVALGGLVYNIKEKVTFNPAVYQTKENEEKWKADKSGPMTAPSFIEGLAVYKSSLSQGANDAPDIGIIFDSSTVRMDLLGETMDPSKPLDKEAVTFIPFLLRAKSTGSLTLKSSDPRDPPLIDPNYLSKEEDVQVLMEAMDIVQGLGKTKAFTKYGAVSYNNGRYSKCVAEIPSGMKEYKKCFIKFLSMAGNNLSGTCKMGSNTDKTAVVDNNLRVHGVENLRIADASILPDGIASLDYQAIEIMIGEKCSADLMSVL